MSYCPNCGKELAEGETCGCARIAAQPAGQEQPYQPPQPDQQPQQQYQQSQQQYQQPQQQYQQPQYQQPQQTVYVQQPVAAQGSNGSASGGFVCALLALIFCWIPFISLFSFILGPLGLILSIVGVAVSGRKGGAGRGLGIAGIVLGAIWLIIILAVIGTVSMFLW